MQTTLQTPVGTFLLETNEHGLVTCGTWLERSSGRDDSARARRHLEQAKDALHEYFAGKRQSFDDLELRPEGTEFQLAVWGALRALPYGSLVSYGELAQRIRRPRAVRAVGQANAKNPLGVVVPCHRVIGKSGDLVGFGGGLPMKRWLLRHEREVLAREARPRRARESWKTRSRSAGEAMTHGNQPAGPAPAGVGKEQTPGAAGRSGKESLDQCQ